jgi:hypothetical protein
MVKLSSFSFSFFGIVTIFLLGITSIHLSDSNFAYGQLVETELEGPIDYEFGVGLFDVGKIDMTTGHYDATFWLSIKTENGNFTEHIPELHLVNGRISDRSNVYVTDHWYNERIQGTFFNQMDFHSYPFSELDLNIMLEFSQTSDELATFSVDPVLSYVLDGIVIPGWSVIDAEYSTTHQEYFELGTYPRYVATYTVQTPFLSSFVGGVLPVIVLGVLSLLTFQIEPKKYLEKMGVVSGLLIGTIFYHTLNVMSQLPALEYLTLQDKFLAIIYVILMFAIFETSMQRAYNKKFDEERGEIINRKARYFLPVVVIGAAAFLWTFG